MHDVMDWWSHLEHKLKVEGFVEYLDTPRKAELVSGRKTPSCLSPTCNGEPEYRDFVRGDEYMAFVVCPGCGGVWNATTHERFH